MKIKVRKGVLETNSSSMHSIVMSKNSQEDNILDTRKYRLKDGVYDNLQEYSHL